MCMYHNCFYNAIDIFYSQQLDHLSIKQFSAYMHACNFSLQKSMIHVHSYIRTCMLDMCIPYELIIARLS